MEYSNHKATREPEGNLKPSVSQCWLPLVPTRVSLTPAFEEQPSEADQQAACMCSSTPDKLLAQGRNEVCGIRDQTGGIRDQTGGIRDHKDGI